MPATSRRSAAFAAAKLRLFCDSAKILLPLSYQTDNPPKPIIRMTQLTNALRRDVARLSASARDRRDSGAFVAQGLRCVAQMAGLFRCRYLFATDAFAAENPALADAAASPYVIVRPADIERMSGLKTPPPVMAVMEIPAAAPGIDPRTSLVLALDAVRDPGNIGTIIRTADWFGLGGIICSADCADIYNPKVVQATMGALGRVAVQYVDDLAAHLSACGVPVYGTFLDGADIYDTALSANGVIVMGNEANGISRSVADTVTRRLLIPPYPAGSDTVESLNVAVAAAITISRFRHP